MIAELAAGKIVDGAKSLPISEIRTALDYLAGWTLSDDGRALERRFETKNFVRAQAIATLAGGVGEMANHHPDISYGWGYCHLRFSTHSAGGVTRNDLICAARLNILF